MSQPGDHIWGSMTSTELAWLIAQATEMESVVEIGSLHGRSAFALLTACPGTVYCIDPWDDEADASYGSFLENCGHFPNLVAIRGRSPEATEQVPDIDMTFIDGDHSYAGIMADIAAWQPKTRRLLCGHDYSEAPDALYPGVAAAVREVFGERAVVVPDTMLWAVEIS